MEELKDVRLLLIVGRDVPDVQTVSSIDLKR
jgi:hypothetical protein